MRIFTLVMGFLKPVVLVPLLALVAVTVVGGLLVYQISAAGTYSQVSAGSLNHTCGVKTDGTLACWGWNGNGEATPPAGSFSQASVGSFHACGVKTDGTLACWGRDGDGQASPPAGTFSQVSAGGNEDNGHTCGVKTDGTLACWGWNSNGQATPPAGSFSQASAGSFHTCGVRTDGNLACWGAGTTNAACAPPSLLDCGQASPPAGTFSQVSAGRFHTCGVRTDGTLACWGYNGSGQASPPAGTFSQVSAGGSHSCGVKTDGTLACWGWNAYGQAPNTPVGQNVEVSLEGGVTLTFTNVTNSGTTTVTTSPSGPPLPYGFERLGDYYYISTTATFTGPVTVCIDYDDSSLSPAVESRLRFLHYVGSTWMDVTTSLNTTTNRLCGQVTSFSPFSVSGLVPEQDADGDGCTSGNELQTAIGSEQTGGRRNPLNFWDFFDVWTHPFGNPTGWERNKTIDLFNDIFGVANRYGAQGTVPSTEEARVAAALTPPTSDTGYHIDFDRSAPPPGGYPWDMGPPNGTIDLFTDIFGVAAQYGHSCT